MKRFKATILCLGVILTSMTSNVIASEPVGTKVNVEESQVESRINKTITKSLKRTQYTEIVSNNNWLNEKVTITFASTANKNEVTKIKVKVNTSKGVTILNDVVLEASEQVSFDIPHNGGTYTVWAKSVDADGSVTIKVQD